MNKPSTKPLGWLVGLGVLLITLGVIIGLVGVFVAAKRKQKYRIEEEGPPPASNKPSVKFPLLRLPAEAVARDGLSRSGLHCLRSK